MTSSLVGSEMCIRDRLRMLEADEKAAEHRKPSSKVEEAVLGKAAAVERKGCLLYTSDAADDM
eukprot:10240562-Prorocentrum_lima.AAC.1